MLFSIKEYFFSFVSAAHDCNTLYRWIVWCDYGVSPTGIESCPVDFCQNGGTCLADFNSVTCMCPSGYIGTQCESGLFSYSDKLLHALI